MQLRGGPSPRAVLFALLAFLAAPRPAEARDGGSIASAFSRAASRAGLRRVAVVGFCDASGRASRDGAVIAERLIAELVESGLDVVERSLLETVLREHRLGASGVVDPATARRLGRFLGVDAVVAGTTVELMGGSAVEVHARLVDVETARVLAAASARVEKEWSDFAPADALWGVAAPQVPRFPGDAPRVDWHDGLASGGPACEAPDERSLDARARYWALRLRDPAFTPAAIRRNPGSDIADPSLRERFFSRLRMWYEQASLAPLDAAERELVARCD